MAKLDGKLVEQFQAEIATFTPEQKLAELRAIMKEHCTRPILFAIMTAIILEAE